MAVLKEDENVPSESERLMIVVIGGTRESMHFFKSFVAIRSIEHVGREYRAGSSREYCTKKENEVVWPYRKNGQREVAICSS